MKLRQDLNDFKVEEIANHIILPKGPFKLYLLEKTGMETFSLINHLSSKNKIPTSAFGIAGLKDRYAVTKQYLTLPEKYNIQTLKEKSFTLTLLGYTDKEIKLGDLESNKFTIVARDVKKQELQSVEERADKIDDEGVPNYFDSQRFGSVIERKFIVKHILKKDYESAVKLFLTEFSKYESRDIKEEKTNIKNNWNNLSKLKIKNRTFIDIINEYEKTKSWIEAYKKIPSKLRELFISAYQSYLWNECIKEVLRDKVRKNHIYGVKYNIGTLFFYKNLTNAEKDGIPKSFVKISDDAIMNNYERNIIERILTKEGLKLEDFNIKQDSGSFFKGDKRDIIFIPRNFMIEEPQFDELNRSFKIRVSFLLPKGSYATIVTKRIFNN